MHKFDAHIFYAIAQEVEAVRSGAYMLADARVQEIPEPINTEHPETLKAIITHCESIGLTSPIPHIERMLEKFAGKYGGYDCARLASDSQELQWRVVDEAREHLFMRMPKDRVDYFNKPSLFGQEVTDKFPDATYDIAEAGSCYATDRYTACVMHLMRALEVSLKAVGIGVGLPNAVELARNNWTAALKGIGDQIGSNDKAADPSWTPEKSTFFKDVRAHLFAVKVAWRDNAMHLEKKYDEKDAKRIYDAAKNFMEHLAEHLDQAGQFTP